MSDLNHRIAAWRELWQRYRSHFAHFWNRRHELTLPTLQPHEAEFLPSALALQTAPASPAGIWTARLLMMMVVSLVLWSTFGHMDIIVAASGKIIPSARTKTIAAVETARVDAVAVVEGQNVHRGDLLITLDTRLSEHEKLKAEGDRDVMALQVARSRALLASIVANRLQPLTEVETANIEQRRVEQARQQLNGQWQDFVAKRTRIDGEVMRYLSQLPLMRQRVQDYKDLAQEHHVSVHALLEKQQELAELEGKLADAQNQREALVAETRKNAEDALNEGLKQSSSAAQDALRAGVHSDLMRLTAPVDGTVQQLTVHTIGGVVAAAQPLMMLVPNQDQVEIEAFIENKDIGFVHEGQKVAIKVETFEYTKYGMIDGVVSHVSRDAIDASGNATDNTSSNKGARGGSKQDKPQAPMYSVKVLLDQNKMVIDGKAKALTPGMGASIEIKTGSRRIIEYFLSPLMQHTHESMNER